MQLGVPRRVEDAEQDQAGGADDGEDDCEPGQDLFARRDVGHQPALVAEPAVGEEGNVEEHGGQDAPRDEERFELGGADVRDVGNLLPLVHGAVVSPFGAVEEPEEEEGEQGCEPDHAGQDWEYLS